MARKFNEYEADEFDVEDYERARKLNKNALREQRRARDNTRYASYSNDNDDQRDYAY